MKLKSFLGLSLHLTLILVSGSCSTRTDKPTRFASRKPSAMETAQVPTWSKSDMNFFIHGSMSTEVVPEVVLRVFVRIYPDLFPRPDLSHFGLIPDPAFGWPVGFSRSPVPHLGGLSSVGINCAACHCAEVELGDPVRVLGVTSHFDAEAYFGAVIVAMFRTAEPANMKHFLTAYLSLNDPSSSEPGQALLASEWQKQEEKIKAAIAADPSGSKGAGAGGLVDIDPNALKLDEKALANNVDLAGLATSLLKLFHNMRAALHVPDQPPDKAPPASGPGRNDAFGLLSLVLFGTPQPYAPVKYGLVWNLDNRRWVHWDGNTQSPIGRNLLASLGLGAPLIDHHAQLNFELVKRQTELSEGIRPPKFPLPIDDALAKRGQAHYKAACAACHDGPENESRLYAVSEIGTEPHRAEAFTPEQAARFNKFLTDLETSGYRPSPEPGIRSTQKYWAATLSGVWARAPYLHNGSVRTMQELLNPSAVRSKSFHRGTRSYDPVQMGYADEGAYLLDTNTPGNSNAGHEFGTRLSATQKQELIEYLKTL